MDVPRVTTTSKLIRLAPFRVVYILQTLTALIKPPVHHMFLNTLNKNFTKTAGLE